MNRIALSAFLFLLACSGKDKDTGDSPDTNPDGGDADTDADADADADTDADTDADCAATITSVTPPDGAEMVPVDAVVTVTFDSSVTGGDVSITSADGAGSVDVAQDGLSATFTPTNPWPEESEVTVDVSACGDSASTTFTTLPAPIDTNLFLGNTYGVLWDDINITEPPNGAALKGLLPVEQIVLQVNAVDGAGAADSIASLAYDVGGTLTPDCTVAVRETADFSLNPYYSFTGNLQIVIDPGTGATADVEAFELLSRVETDGQSMTDVRISGLVDTEQFLPGQDCNSVAVQLLLSPTCMPCGIAASGQCMLLEMDTAAAPVIPYFDLGTLCP